MAVDITAFYRPQLPGLESKPYDALAGKTLPAVLMGPVGMTGSLNGQRLAMPREPLRASADDPGEAGLKRALLQKVARKLAADEVAMPDVGFRLGEVQAAGGSCPGSSRLDGTQGPLIPGKGDRRSTGRWCSLWCALQRPPHRRHTTRPGGHLG